MKLSDEEKDALADHFRNRDLYDPSKAPEQETADFTPDVPGMNCGGEMGYAGGGSVPDIDLGLGSLLSGTSDYSGPSISAGTETARVPLTDLPTPMVPQMRETGPMASLGGADRPRMPVAGPSRSQGRPLPSTAPIVTPAPSSAAPMGQESPVKSLKSDEFNELLAYLKPSRGQRIGQAAMSGLAGLADAIMTGVAKAPSSSFQKNLAEKDIAQNKELADVLRSKYEAGFKGQELDQASKRLAEEVRAAQAGEKLGAERLAEEKRAHDLEAGQRTTGLENEARKLRVDAANKVIDAYEKGSGLGSFIGTSVRPSQAEYNQALKVIQNDGDLGGAAPSILTATNKTTGQRIVSTDGGKTWRPAK